MSSPGQIPLSWLLNGGCHCSSLKYCSRGPNNASHPTTHKCSGVQINLHLKLTTKNIPNLHLFIHLSIHLTYHKNYLKLTLSVHPSIHLTYHKNSKTYTNPSIHSISNLHLSTHPPFLYLKLTLSILPSIHLTYH